MTTFSEQINNLAVRAATECKTLHSKAGALANLNTTDKTALVSAINEVKTQANTAASSLNSLSDRLSTAEGGISTNSGDISTIRGSITTINSNITTINSTLDGLKKSIESSTDIDDTKASTTSTYSSSKIESVVSDAKTDVKNDILGGAGEAYDTLKELADLIQTSQSSIEALEKLAAGHVKYDASQSLTDTQKTQARTNIGAASAADLTSAKSDISTNAGNISTNTSDIKALKDAIGDTTVDFVKAFEDALESD